MPETPPATCHTVVRIDSPRYRPQILAALGIVTRDLGLTFAEGDDYTLRFEERSPIPVEGFEGFNAVFNGDVIYIQAVRFSKRYATYLALHELGHWLRMEHNSHRSSLMNPAGWPQRARFTARDLTEARALTSHCR